MKRKGSFHKIFFYTLIQSILIIGGSLSYGYIWAKTFEKIDIEIESSMQKTLNCGYIIAGSTSSIFVPKQPPKAIGIFIQPRVLKLNSKVQDNLSNLSVSGTWEIPNRFSPEGSN